MWRYTYNRLHIPSGSRSEGTKHYDESSALLAQRALFEDLNDWNRSAPGIWQYWLTPGAVPSWDKDARPKD